MASIIPSGQGFFRELEKLIKFPPNLLSAEIRIAVDEVVTVKCTFMAEFVSDASEPTCKTYQLEEIEKKENE